MQLNIFRRSKSPQILIVDDDANWIIVAKSWLESFNVEVKAFTSPLAALDDLKIHPVQAALVDYTMPEMNGLVFAQEARKLDSGLPIVILSAHSNISTKPYPFVMKEAGPSCFTDALDIALNTTIYGQKWRIRDRQLEPFRKTCYGDSSRTLTAAT